MLNTKTDWKTKLEHLVEGVGGWGVTLEEDGKSIKEME